jgi:predicted Zn-ribbon and HTH transcriptional regulator
MQFKSIYFRCKSCGAPLKFSPIDKSLRCDFCDTSEIIDKKREIIQEYDFKTALYNLTLEVAKKEPKEIVCSNCGASFASTPYSISSNCPYCATPAITDFQHNDIPKSMLPFSFNQEEAQKIFREWIGSLWFAPSKLKDYVDGHKKLSGIYLPHWTYDSQTNTPYRGQRGDIYYVSVRKTVIVNGEQQEVESQEQRIRWTFAQGRIDLFFDDVTVGATDSIARNILDELSPWDTSALVPFDEKILSGFEASEYSIGLDDSFEIAKVKMDETITQHIKRDIGGDQQLIDYKETSHSHITYKNVLFPVWSTSFEWNNKNYVFGINGQTGKIVGDRPYSVAKIVSLVVAIGVVLAVAFYFNNK